MGGKISETIDYLVIGHLTHDITPFGHCLGGTASYAALTALSFGLNVGIVTSWDEGLPLGKLGEAIIHNEKVKDSTTFENIETENGRIQKIYHHAKTLDFSCIPDPWKDTPIVHLGPIAEDVLPVLAEKFPHSQVGITPQGWLRKWDLEGHINAVCWDDFISSEKVQALEKADAVVMSLEDLDRSEDNIKKLANMCKILIITEGEKGARLYWQNSMQKISAPKVTQLDPVGAGDIFAAVFFIILKKTTNALEAARLATTLASFSVTRQGLASVPTNAEIQAASGLRY